jgi:hypothetical protein
MEYNLNTEQKLYDQDALRLEIVTTCVNFDDILEQTLITNHDIADHYIVVTSFSDKKTQMLAKSFGATCVPTDLFYKNGRNFNKGAAINAGFGRFQYHGFRLNIDSDIILPSSFRRILFNHSFLDRNCLYGADRIDVKGFNELNEIKNKNQHKYGFLMVPNSNNKLSARYVDHTVGYCPLGYFQLYHASCQKPYPFSLGDASHDDISFSMLWPQENRRLLPTVVVHHLVPENHKSKMGENWDGNRKMPRLK